MPDPALADKPIKRSVAFYWRDEAGRFSAVKRPADDEYLPLVWGLPAGSLKGDESWEEAVVRAGHNKLGVTLEILRYTGEDKIDRGDYILHLREYEVRILEGSPTVPQPDNSITQYLDLKVTADPKILLEAAEKGSLCSRIYLRNAGLWTKQSSLS